MTTNSGGFAAMNTARRETVRLAMESLWLTGRVLPVGAHLVVVHTFRSAEPDPVEVVYAFGLPRDAALRRFKVVAEGFQVRSELRPVAEAQEIYERGVQKGHLATLARTYRDGRVNLSVGNIRPGELVKVFLELVAGVDLRDENLRFRFPFTLAPCYHAKARGVEVEPGTLEMTLPEVEFGDLLLPHWMEDDASLHRVGFDLAVAWPGKLDEVGSPSHRIRVTGTGDGEARVTLGAASDVPDRDLVLDVCGTPSSVRAYGGTVTGQDHHVSVVVPSTWFGATAAAPRHVIFLLDRSGSMGGAPLEQAKQALTACLGALNREDRFNLLAFDDSTESFRQEFVRATRECRDQARTFLNGVQARGGTELGPALEESLRWARDGGGADVFLLTDGQVSATEDLLARVRGAGVRVHCLGIGSASQDRFLALLAETTGAISRMVTPRERVDLEALELFASAGSCRARDLKIKVNTQPALHWLMPPRQAVMTGYPLVLLGQARTAVQGRLRLSWRDGQAERKQVLELPPADGRDAATVRLLQGAKLIAGLESTQGPETPGTELTKRHARRWERKLEELGREYGLANRVLSLVAVVERPGADGTRVPKTLVVPVGMPEDVALSAYAGAPQVTSMCVRNTVGFTERALSTRDIPMDRFCSEEFIQTRLTERFTDQDALVDLAGRLDADGGYPGFGEHRILKSLGLLGLFLAEGNTIHTGPFRPHVQRLVQFVRAQVANLTDLAHRRLAERLLALVETDPTPVFAIAHECRMLISMPEQDAMIERGWTRLDHILILSTVLAGQKSVRSAKG